MADNQKLPVPKVFAWLASLLTLSVIVAEQFLPRGEHPLSRILGVLMLVPAAIFIFIPFYQLAKHGKKNRGDHYMQTKQVFNQGLYALIRHPQYLGYSLLAVGFALISQHWGACFLAALSFTCFYIQAIREESYCKEKFGMPYVQYQQKVPRFNFLVRLWWVLRGSGND